MASLAKVESDNMAVDPFIAILAERAKAIQEEATISAAFLESAKADEIGRRIVAEQDQRMHLFKTWDTLLRSTSSGVLQPGDLDASRVREYVDSTGQIMHHFRNISSRIRAAIAELERRTRDSSVTNPAIIRKLAQHAKSLQDAERDHLELVVQIHKARLKCEDASTARAGLHEKLDRVREEMEEIRSLI